MSEWRSKDFREALCAELRLSPNGTAVDRVIAIIEDFDRRSPDARDAEIARLRKENEELKNLVGPDGAQRFHDLLQMEADFARLREEVAGEQASAKVLGDLLRRTAQALGLHGEWDNAEKWDGWKDIPERVARLREALKSITRVSEHEPDCNLCGEFLDARDIARAALASPAPVVECPRCEGQKYDKGSCSLCNNTGLVNEAPKPSTAKEGDVVVISQSLCSCGVVSGGARDDDPLCLVHHPAKAEPAPPSPLLALVREAVKVGQALRESTKYCERMGVHSGAECRAWDDFLRRAREVGG